MENWKSLGFHRSDLLAAVDCESSAQTERRMLPTLDLFDLEESSKGKFGRISERQILDFGLVLKRDSTSTTLPSMFVVS